MTTRRFLWGCITLLIILGAVAAWASFYHLTFSFGGMPEDAISKPKESLQPTLEDLRVEHTLKDGMHVYSGVVLIPSGCEDIATGAQTIGIDPPHLNITLVTNPVPNCTAPGTTEESFSVSIGVPQTPILDSISLNGALVSAAVVEK